MDNSLNLQEINQEEAVDLGRFFLSSDQFPFFLFGRRGTGKTSIIYQIAKELNYKIGYLNLSVLERPDLAGYPNLHTDSDVITYKSPYFLPTLEDGKKSNTILIFDEVDKADSELSAPLLELLQSKTINGRKIDVAAFALTGNLLNEGAYSKEVSSALLDRGAKYYLKFNFEKWVSWCKLNNFHELLLGFLRSNENLAVGEIENSAYASPSPREWAKCSDALYKAEKEKITDINLLSTIIAGFVGHQASIKFKTWFLYYRQFENDIQLLIEGKKIDLLFNKLDYSSKLAFIISGFYQAKNKYISSFSKIGKIDYSPIANFLKYLEKEKIEDELLFCGLSNSFDFEIVTKYDLYNCKPFFNKFNELHEIVNSKR